MSRSPPPALAARQPADPEPDLSSLLVTHRAIRLDLARLAGSLARTAAVPLTSARCRALRRYGAALFSEISSHLDDEDGILWPLIAATAGQCVDLAPLTDDHQAIAATLARAARAVDFTGSPGVQAAEPVKDLREMLDQHITDEESQIVPAIRRYLPASACRSYQAQGWRRASLASLRFRAPWLARAAAPWELPALANPGGWRARLLLLGSSRRYARLERRAFGCGGVDAGDPSFPGKRSASRLSARRGSIRT
jgi:hypothetical protein